MSDFLDRLAAVIVGLLIIGAMLFFVGMLVYLAWIHPHALLLYAVGAVVFWAIVRTGDGGRLQRNRVKKRKLG